MDASRNDDEAIGASRPRKKLRKERPCYSCSECRRLKMKCDRQVPCSNCIRRQRVEFCTIAAGRKANSRESEAHSGPTSDAAIRVPELQVNASRTQDASSAYLVFDQRHMQETQQPHHLNPTQAQSHALSTRRAHPSRSGAQSGAEHLTSSTLTLEPAIDPNRVSATLVSSSRPEENLHSTRSTINQRSNPGLPPVDNNEQGGSYGTLLLDEGGRSVYLGPTAGSEWLKDSETQDVPDSPMSTGQHPNLVISQHGGVAVGTASTAFPFSVSVGQISTADLLSYLPPKDEAWSLVESYYRYCAWHHDVAPKPSFQKTFDRVYALVDGHSLSFSVDPQEMALVFIILAQGTMFNIELPNYDPSIEDWLRLSERALVKGEFLSNNSVAGLQTLHLMAHVHINMDKGQNGDNAWPLWGLVMRLAQAMGMHRDGTRWNLPESVVEERRKVFWECNAADTFQAHCFSRPCAINPEHCDTAFPTEPHNTSGEKSYSILRFELSQLSAQILNMTMKVQKPTYSEVTELDSKLYDFERSLPFSLRCRAAFLAMPSRYPQPQTAIEASPEPSRRSMTISFQQMNLALNISETIINLHRPYYARALYDDVDDHVSSIFAPSYLTVIERCAIIIAIVSDIHARFPAVSTRQWNFWFHVFSSALCLGTLVLRDPSNNMATFVLAQINTAISLFTSLIQQGASTPRYRRNRRWLIKLHARASSKISKQSGLQSAEAQRELDADHSRSGEDRDDGLDVELLGWRTRLIERTGQDYQVVRTVPHAANSTSLHIADNPISTSSIGHRGGTETFPNVSFDWITPDSTNKILHDFWDPMLLQDVFDAPEDGSNPFANGGMAWWDSTDIVSNGPKAAN